MPHSWVRHASPVRMMYRFRQLWRALRGSLTAADRGFVRGLLGADGAALFEQMPRFDQRHCLDVCQTLQRGGYDHPALLRAALLHDIGKVDEHGHSIPLLYYGVFVVMRRVAPAWYTRAATNGRGLLRPFAIHATHEQRSATRARAAHLDAETLAILDDYAARHETPATQALAWADDQN